MYIPMDIPWKEAIVGVSLVAFPGCKTSSEDSTVQTTSNDYISSEFRRHLIEDLLPFWVSSDALGVDGDNQGDFPTWRCNDGKAFVYYGERRPGRTFENCKEIAAHYQPGDRRLEWTSSDLHGIDGWIKVPLQQGAHEFVRTRSRQIFGYCVAFHLTGRLDLLALCRKGAQFLLKNAFHRETDGSLTSKSVLGKGPTGVEHFVSLRTSSSTLERQYYFNPQDQAYALQGLTMYYQVTRDVQALNVMLQLQQSIFSRFYDHDNKTMHPYRKGDPLTPTLPDQLVDHLDQINAYLLLGAKALRNNPENPAAIAAAAAWDNHLVDLSEKIFATFLKTFVMVDEESGEVKVISYDVPDDPLVPITTQEPIPVGKKLTLFLGNEAATEVTTGTLTDFGHSIKTFWMIDLIGRHVGGARGKRLRQASKPRALALLAEAFNQDDSGTWCDGYTQNWADENPRQRFDCNKTWWIQNELNQTALHFSLDDSNRELTNRYVTSAFRYYRDKLVDRRSRGVFHQYNTENFGSPPVPQVNTWYPKAHHWRNAYHAFEHALIGTIVTESLRHGKVRLYYAYEDKDSRSYPYAYFYKAKAGAVTVGPTTNGVTGVEFRSLAGVRHPDG